MNKILFVEDDAPLLKVYGRKASGLGRTPLLAANRAAALELARNHKPELAVIDLILREDNGLNVIRDLRRLRLPMTLILVSASMCVQYAMLGVEAGADDCFEKGVTVEQLIARTESGKRTELEHGAVVPTLAEMQWQYIVRTLDDVGGNRTRAAEVLGISRPKLLRAIDNHGSGVMRPDVIRRRRQP